MDIYLTYDYELFFGERTGSALKCMIEPTNFLLDLVRKYNIQMTFFIDVGYLIRLEEEKESHSELMKDLISIKEQILLMQKLNCSVQLHIHPHWEKVKYVNNRWEMNVENCYKLDDFTDNEIEDIVRRYKTYLDQLTGEKSTVFRAGGWCIQPFSRLKEVFQDIGIKIDSSVFVGGHFESKDYYFDFRNAPKLSKYHFEEDVCIEEKGGSFIEYPISSYRYSPLFYWRLYVLGRIFPSQHKMLGDGIFLSQPGRKKSVLTNFTWNHVSSDGYYVTKLESALNKLLKMNCKEMVVIGHPKSNTVFSENELDKFIGKYNRVYNFKSLKV